MRIRAALPAAALALGVAVTACTARGGFFRQYEYEEEIYLSLDGTATMYVNASIPALDALRGAAFDVAPNVPVDRDAVRRFFSTPDTHVTALSVSIRSHRRFVHVKMDVDSVERLGEAAPFAWSRYRLSHDGSLDVFDQAVGRAAGREVGPVGWDGSELVAFRLHLPSRIVANNTGQGVLRGNVLVWEQPLAERLRGVPLAMDARMETQSILSRTLWLFGLTFVAVAAVFLAVIGWALKRGPKAAEV